MIVLALLSCSNYLIVQLVRLEDMPNTSQIYDKLRLISKCEFKDGPVIESKILSITKKRNFNVI